MRGPEFVTTRLARAAADATRSRDRDITVGNLDAQVDWGFAGDYAQAMLAMLATPEVEDLVIASGALHRVRDFAELAFAHVGLDWREHVRQDPAVHRPVSRAVYHGDISRIRHKLGWQPTTSFASLVGMLVDAQMQLP
jgi:GDPmannose 4,6-dehydratase